MALGYEGRENAKGFEQASGVRRDRLANTLALEAAGLDHEQALGSDALGEKTQRRSAARRPAAQDDDLEAARADLFPAQDLLGLGSVGWTILGHGTTSSLSFLMLLSWLATSRKEFGS